ncbi:hypothetical protein Ancab_012529 [Ancistrocladus abbreviatus]
MHSKKEKDPHKAFIKEASCLHAPQFAAYVKSSIQYIKHSSPFKLLKMLSNLKNFLPLFFICVALTAISANVHAHDDLVHVLCQGTPNQHLCESSLRSDPRSSTADAEGLILIMVDVVRSKFADSLRYVNELTKEARQPEIVRALKECAWYFRVVLEANVGVAVNAVNLGDPKFGEQAMIDSANEAMACERQFSGKFRSPLTERTNYLEGISYVAAALVKILE